MKKRFIIKASVLIVLIIGMTVGCTFLKEDDVKEDSIKFKEEYEALNNTVRESDGQKYNNIDINEDNPIKYVTPKEATKIIKEESGVIYIGAPWCPWCRNAIPVLFEATKNNGVDTVYYVDLTEYRNIWEIVDGELVKSQKEKEGYYDLLNALDEVLGSSTYKLKDENGQEYDTNEKRVYMPMVLGIKGGKITETHTGTVTLNEGQDKYSALTETQKNELLNIYDKLVKSSIPEGKCGVGLDDACD